MAQKILKRDIMLIASIGIYLFTAIVFTFLYFIDQYDSMEPEVGYSETILLRLIAVIGVLASSARAGADLLADVREARIRKVRFQSLAYALRPLQGGAGALIIYFAVRAALLIFEKGWPTINPWGFFAVAGLGGLLAHSFLDKFGPGLRLPSGRRHVVTRTQVGQTLEHIVEEIRQSDATRNEKAEANRRLVAFLEQPLVSMLFGAVIEDLLLAMSRTAAEEGRNSKLGNHLSTRNLRELLLDDRD